MFIIWWIKTVIHISQHIQTHRKKGSQTFCIHRENEQKEKKVISIANVRRLTGIVVLSITQTNSQQTKDESEKKKVLQQQQQKCNQNDWHWIIASNFSHFLVRHFHLCAHLVAFFQKKKNFAFVFSCIHLDLYSLIFFVRCLSWRYLFIYMRDQVTVSEYDRWKNNNDTPGTILVWIDN